MFPGGNDKRVAVYADTHSGIRAALADKVVCKVVGAFRAEGPLDEIPDLILCDEAIVLRSYDRDRIGELLDMAGSKSEVTKVLFAFLALFGWKVKRDRLGVVFLQKDPQQSGIAVNVTA